MAEAHEMSNAMEAAATERPSARRRTRETMQGPGPQPKPSTVKLLLFSGSLREGSTNTKLITLAASVMKTLGAEVDVAPMRLFDCASFDQDEEDRNGLPPGALELKRRLEACDAFVIASPEYNASMPGHLKNAIDWVSRARPQPFHARHCLLMSASPSMAGGNRGLWSLRVPLEHLGARVFPDMFSLAQSHKALDATGQMVDGALRARFDANLRSYLDLVEAAKHYPCMKKAWVEFLGEPGTEGRVDPA
jgi:chromate reductase